MRWQQERNGCSGDGGATAQRLWWRWQQQLCVGSGSLAASGKHGGGNSGGNMEALVASRRQRRQRRQRHCSGGGLAAEVVAAGRAAVTALSQQQCDRARAVAVVASAWLWHRGQQLSGRVAVAAWWCHQQRISIGSGGSGGSATA